ncbi:transcription cofactor vestigial-like protein 2 [Trichomycterus rosablanca]|uniref:transcription cofactor vestigial-like protein 2 n=1 Tax=Trichomycterus rosablanca TaxID=2290929 RepID=UPI002F355229
MMEGRSGMKCTTEAPHSVILTYYEGDINTVVDEHFFRALNKSSMPKDLSTKPRTTPPTQPGASSSFSWSPSGSSSMFSPRLTSHLGQSQCFSSEGAVRAPSVIRSNPETSAATWGFPKHYTAPLPTHPLQPELQMNKSRPDFYWH